jgi:hypothetical protein
VAIEAIQKPRRYTRSGIKGITWSAIPACLLIGMGIGFLFDEVTVGIFIGLGVGFLVMLILNVNSLRHAWR